jgi:hypothetical protein
MEEDFGYFQTCPKCKGQKKIMRPPNVPYGLNMQTEQVVYTCDICKGEGIIQRPYLFDYDEEENEN